MRNLKSELLLTALIVLFSTIFFLFVGDIALGFMRPEAKPLTPEKIRNTPPRTTEITGYSAQRFIRLREWHPNAHVRVPELPTRTDGSPELPVWSSADIDADGFIMPSKVHPDASANIFFLGGSTTECFDMAAEDRFPYLVGRILEQRTGAKINSFNAAMGGNTTLHDLNILLNKVFPMRADYVVLMENINDLAMLLAYKSLYVANHSRSPLVTIEVGKRQEVQRSELALAGLKSLLRSAFPNIYRAAWEYKESGKPKAQDEFADARGIETVIDPNQLAAKFAANLRIFVAVTRQMGARPVLMTQQNRFSAPGDEQIRIQVESARPGGLSYDEYTSLHRTFNETVRSVAMQLSVPLIDLAAQVPQDADHLYDAVHLTAKGSRLAAGIIATALLSDDNAANPHRLRPQR